MQKVWLNFSVLCHLTTCEYAGQGAYGIGVGGRGMHLLVRRAYCQYGVSPSYLPLFSAEES